MIFVTKVKQINSQSDLISMSSFAGLSYLTIRSFVYIFYVEILVFSIFTMSTKLDPIAYFRNFTNVYFISMNKWQELISFTYSLLLGQSQLKSQVSILLWKGPPKLRIECHLVPLWAFSPKLPRRFPSNTIFKETKVIPFLIVYGPCRKSFPVNCCSIL